jgi:acetyl-CoA carboxylase / biotin carboxylase 1
VRCLRADGSARGSVLEADGVVEIKFRRRDLLALMRRSDAVLQDLQNRRRDGDRSVTDAVIRSRQEELLPIYHSIALHFAAMHETPVRCFSMASFVVACRGGVRQKLSRALMTVASS